MDRQGTHTNDRINVAIDGPAGAGKSTVARLVARELSYIYVDTGAMYRAITWYMLREGIAAEEHELVDQKVQNMAIELLPEKDVQKVLINGEDMTPHIRSLQVSGQVSQYSKIEGVRSRLSHLQRQMALRKGVVMDGRDIGTTVLPDAEVKIFMTASVEERALRRYKELKDTETVTLQQLEYDIAARDRLDEGREISPLRRAEDAILLDTTHMDILQAVEAIVSHCRTYVNGERNHL
ncbi:MULTISPECIES: (d)CMP kinase [unclassified Paenibacillus]|uniref:(d)CMP kinase n=1 Tax=unclassified Paenibacillus TaxID=185978 RepID=UPI0003E23412|nr:MULTISPECIES: (d)CMP kinase [unclassified Paenibacillus]ETT44120.1 cytidylate kinase [Paenibacillus sp. FSL R7-269]OMF96325.1 cytidylate kinase [Paenibacillus sp. FSL R7-0337]